MLNIEIDPKLASLINKNNWAMFEEHEQIFRNNHQRCSIKKKKFKNFALFTGKHLSWSLFLIKLQAFSSAIVYSIHFSFSTFLSISMLCTNWILYSTLTHFQPMIHFYTPWKHQKTGGFLMFPRVIEVKLWLKMGSTWYEYRKASAKIELLFVSIRFFIMPNLPLIILLTKWIILWHYIKKWIFPLRISSVNVTKSTGNCQFGHIYWRNP